MEKNLTLRENVIELMRSSRSESEWNKNCDLVKRANGGYPSFWFAEIILSGLMDKILGAGSSEIHINALNL